ncbi:hypothetical protein [uncultured Albimonas sp.]|uniref:hypothetical protein n=1 Tax=uncultured Albimonas sp. TaxID=1331701 RepID=UPI0030EC3062|tara:strand:+ start:7902 stop:8198 length:297 start_codon:yes stop_codon:yes gene_type:complete
MTLTDFLIGAIPLAFMIGGVIYARVLRYRYDLAVAAGQCSAKPAAKTSVVGALSPEGSRITGEMAPEALERTVGQRAAMEQASRRTEDEARLASGEND